MKRAGNAAEGQSHRRRRMVAPGLPRTARRPLASRPAHEPIMIGNAAFGFNPSRLTRIMHGA